MFNHHFYHIFTVQVYNYCLQSKGGTFFVFWTSNSKTIAYISVFFPQKYVNHRLTKYSSKLLQTPITTSLNIDDYSCYIFLYKTVLQISHLLRKKHVVFVQNIIFLTFRIQLFRLGFSMEHKRPIFFWTWKVFLNRTS